MDQSQSVRSTPSKTRRLVAQIHDRQITDVRSTSLGQCAPSATRAAQPSTSMIDGDRQDRPPAGRLPAHAPPARRPVPKVTAKNVIVVDGNVKPLGLPTTAISSRDGRGRAKIAFVDSAPYCSSARKPPAISEAPPAGHDVRQHQRDHHHVVLGRRRRQPADRRGPPPRVRRCRLERAGHFHIAGKVRLHPHAGADQDGDDCGQQERKERRFHLRITVPQPPS